MLPFEVSLTPGDPPYRQIAYAATRAILAGELLPGSPFPSVRELSQELKINVNTALRVVAELTREGLLEMRPGVGTFVAAGRRGTAAERQRILAHDLERVVVEARRLGVTRAEAVRALETLWDTLFDADDGATR
jgi:GntR family transcriptional regulator